MQVTGTFVVRRLGELYQGKDKRDQEYALRSLVVSGEVELAGQVEDVERLELVCFKQGKEDKLFDGVGTLYAGSEVELTFTMDWVWMVEQQQNKADRRRLVLKPGRIVGCKVLSRADAPAARAAAPRLAGAFVDAAG